MNVLDYRKQVMIDSAKFLTEWRKSFALEHRLFITRI
jgi:hypothetical protein